MSPKISQSDRVEIYEGIAHVISAMPLQDAGAALKQMSLELLQKIHEAATTPSASSKAQTDAICGVCVNFAPVVLLIEVLPFCRRYRTPVEHARSHWYLR